MSQGTDIDELRTGTHTIGNTTFDMIELSGKRMILHDCLWNRLNTLESMEKDLEKIPQLAAELDEVYYQYYALVLRGMTREWYDKMYRRRTRHLFIQAIQKQIKLNQDIPNIENPLPDSKGE